MSVRRVDYVDIFRAFGIIFMVMGHIGFGGRFDYFIHAFHMPMFFFVSGMFFNPEERNYLSVVRKKARTLLIPYVCFGAFHYLVWLYMNRRGLDYLSMLRHLLLVNTEGLGLAGALWFLTALFLTQCMYYALSIFVRNKFTRNVIIILLTLFGLSAYHVWPFRLYWAFGASCVGLGLYHAGYLLTTHGKLFTLSLPQTLIAGVVATAMIFMNGYVNMRLGIYGNGGGGMIFSFVNALVSSVVGLNLSKLIHSYFKTSKLDSHLQYIGRNSIIYVCMNQIVIHAATRLVSFLARSFHIELHAKFSGLIIFLLTMALLYLLNEIFSRTKLKAAAGRSSDFRLNVAFVLLAVVAAGAGLGVAHARHKITPSVVRLPEWSRLNTQKMPGTLSDIIAKNLKYLLNTQWNSGQRQAFLKSSSFVYSSGELSAFEENEIRKSSASFTNWRNERYLYLPNVIDSTQQENSLRPWGHLCFTVASALKFNLYDPDITGISRDDAQAMTVKLVASLARSHCSNTASGWGSQWQSALWAENIAFAAWLLWDELEDIDRSYVVNMLVSESDRFNDYRVPYFRDENGRLVHDNDTKGEENAWNSRILSLAVCMLPEHPNNHKWQDKLTELLMSSTARPEDVTAFDVLHGSNLNSDGTVINHGLVHIDYMNVILEGMIDTAIIYGLAGREFPGASTFNADKIFTALVSVDLGTYDSSKAGHHFYERTDDGRPSPEVNMPGVNDWGGKWYAGFYLTDTIAEVFGLDGECPYGLKASDWAGEHLGVISGMVSRNDTGQFFTEGENNFVSGETYAMHNLMKSYMLRRIFAE